MGENFNLKTKTKMTNITRIGRGYFLFFGKSYKISNFSIKVMESDSHDKHKRSMLDLEKYLRQKEKLVILETLVFCKKQELVTV